jgi:hypothetical protein
MYGAHSPAAFNEGGFKELQANLAQLRSFRLLLGFEPKTPSRK